MLKESFLKAVRLHIRQHRKNVEAGSNNTIAKVRAHLADLRDRSLMHGDAIYDHPMNVTTPASGAGFVAAGAFGVARDHLLAIKKLNNKLSKKNPKKDLKEEIDKSEFEIYHGLQHGDQVPITRHRSTVHGHDVSVDFSKLHRDKNEYEVDFRVNGQVNRQTEMTPKHGLAITAHVKKVVKSFIHHHKPDSLSFVAFDSNRDLKKTKHKLYVRELKKMGATEIEQISGNHIAHFKEHFQEFLNVLMEDVSKDDFQTNDINKHTTHTKTVHGNRVQVVFKKLDTPKDIYGVDFSVNGETDSYHARDAGMNPSHSMAIAKHVKKVVKSFIQHHKPDGLSFVAGDSSFDAEDKKTSIYDKGLRSMGAKSIEHHSSNHRTAYFREGFQEFLDTLMEDAPTNSTGPAIAGMSAQSEPGVKKSRQRSLQKKNAQDAETRDGFTKVWRRKALPVMEMKKPKWEVPAEPGSTPVPTDHVRLYHQTDGTNMSSIRRHGIKLSKAKGIEGPRAIYADEYGFYGKPHTVPSVEFHVHKSEYHAPFVNRDVVEPDKIVATHKPWHDLVRYIDDDPKLRKEVEDGKHDHILKDKGSRESKAVRFVKKRAKANLKEAVEVKRGTFAGNDTFVVPSHVYHEAVHHKAKGAHWTKYLNETEYGTAIREFANNNPHKPIVLEDEKTGYLTYARYGNTNKR